MSRLTATELRELGLPENYTAGEPGGWRPEYSAAAGPQWNNTDIYDAMVQTTVRSMGGLKTATLHPLAQQMIEAAHDSLADVSQALIAARFGPAAVDRSLSGPAIIQAALGTPDLPALLGDTARGIAREFRSHQLADLMSLAYPLEALDYRPQSYSAIDLENLPAPSGVFGREYVQVEILATGEPFRLLAIYAKLGISIQALANDDRGLIRAGVQALLTAAARNEAQLDCSLIADNATVSAS